MKLYVKASRPFTSQDFILGKSKTMMSYLEYIIQEGYQIRTSVGGQLAKDVNDCIRKLEAAEADLKKVIGFFDAPEQFNTINSVQSSDDVMHDHLPESGNSNHAYKLEDTYGAPQAGVDVKYFETWSDLDEYLEDNPEVHERVLEGYARIIESASTIDTDEDSRNYPEGYFDEYFGQTAYEKYGDLVSKECAGLIISKRADDGEEPGGLIYEADRLGIEDFFDLLRCLEGMCYNGKAVEISDYQYKVL